MAVKSVKIKGPKYPDNLKTIFDPPKELFVNGDILPSDNSAIAIVGTRRATYYGLAQCEKLSYDLAIRGITIVSGMASGIDTAAHRGALKASGGRTIAVLGSGHNHIYPRENKKLYDEIVKRGAVVSEFPPDTLPFKTNFPRRNRIISGMSKGVVVIEAPRRSGALITADFALEQGRDVFAMPGSVGSARSQGTHGLIKEGAKLVEKVSDILEELPFLTPGVKKELKVELGDDEKRVFEALEEEPVSIDKICEALNLPAHKISQALLKLELKRLIKALPGERFVRV